ncbi:MAG: hypothetical protein ABIG96_01550 [Candidatus Micrarchaeota archaeon]
MAEKRKPRVVSVKRKPRVVDETDYSLLLENKEPDNLILGKRAERREIHDSARDKLREDMLADITPVKPPLEHLELEREIDEDRKKRHSIGRKIRKVVGLE